MNEEAKSDERIGSIKEGFLERVEPLLVSTVSKKSSDDTYSIISDESACIAVSAEPSLYKVVSLRPHSVRRESSRI